MYTMSIEIIHSLEIHVMLFEEEIKCCNKHLGFSLLNAKSMNKSINHRDLGCCYIFACHATMVFWLSKQCFLLSEEVAFNSNEIVPIILLYSSCQLHHC